MNKKIFLIITTALSLVILLTAFVFSMTHYAPWTKVSTELFVCNVGFKTKNQILTQIENKFNEISIQISGRDETIAIPLQEIGELKKETVAKKLEGKNMHTNINMGIEEIFSINEEKLHNLLQNKMSAIEKQEAQNAYIDYVEGKYVIVPEQSGNIIKEGTIEKIEEKIKQYDLTIDLNKLDAYKNAEICKDNEILRHNLRIYKEYENFVLTYKINDAKEIIDATVINNWLLPNIDSETSMINSDNPFTVNEKGVSDFIENVKKKYGFNNEDIFTTSTNEKIVYSNASSESWLDEDALKADIVKHILENLSEEKDMPIKTTPDIKNKANKSIGNTYIEVSIKEQHIWFYENGELIVESDIVTGNQKRKYDTRKGVFLLTYKCKNATLRGPGYASFVNYWMPFDGGIGLHDATWRDEFGGEIYKTDGSHGCVNLPLNTAKIIYEHINCDIPIVVW